MRSGSVVSRSATKHVSWGGSVNTLWGHTYYIGLTAVILNLAVSAVLTLVLLPYIDHNPATEALYASIDNRLAA